jgi:hypothetical protein
LCSLDPVTSRRNGSDHQPDRQRNSGTHQRLRGSNCSDAGLTKIGGKRQYTADVKRDVLAYVAAWISASAREAAAYV